MHDLSDKPESNIFVSQEDFVALTSQGKIALNFKKNDEAYGTKTLIFSW